MSDPVTQGQFFEAVQQLRDHIDEKHTSQRQFISTIADRIERKIEDHVKDDRIVADDVVKLMNEREIASKQSISRSTVIALIVSTPGALYALWTLIHALR